MGFNVSKVEYSIYSGINYTQSGIMQLERAVENGSMTAQQYDQALDNINVMRYQTSKL